MTEAQETELAFWQSRCDDMQVALDTVREHRDELQKENLILKDGLKMYSSMVDRMKIAMSQGVEL
jgi:hypothetical protein